MPSLAEKIVKYRNRILAGALIICAVCGFLALKVPINTDMTKYLPDTSPMKQGIDLMAEEFSALQMPNTIRVMLRGASEDSADLLTEKLSQMENVSSVVRTDETEKEEERFVLFTVSTPFDYQSPEELRIESDILSLKKTGFDLVMVNDNTMGMQIPLLTYILAVALLMLVLFVMCASWVEPFLFLAAIGIAIVLNLGTNIILGSVSQTTYSMTAILQLVLSMDYSVILMNRYRQEKQSLIGQGVLRDDMDRPDRDHALRGAMTLAWQRAFSSVASSGLTTFVGLIMLVFMRFRIGKDLGLVLAKGVLLSMICVLTVLPALILLFDGAIEKTRKKVLHIPTAALARFSYRFRWVLTVGFVLFFGLFWYLHGLADTSYSLSAKDPIAEVFPPANPVVLLYDNEDETFVSSLVMDVEKEEFVTQVFSYGNVLARQRTPDEMADFIRDMTEGGFSSYLDMEEMTFIPDASSLTALYAVYALLSGGNETGTMSVEQIVSFVSENMNNPLLAPFISEETKEQIGGMSGMLESAKDMLVGPEHSLMMIYTTLPVESDETEAFIRGLKKRLDEEAQGRSYLIGNSPMSVEMEDSFAAEVLLITLLTAAAIFTVVAVTFRQLLIPVLLVSLVQCGVFMTITTTWLLGYSMYYLAIIIVQCILMGATVDYAILMTNYYREVRQSLEKAPALRETYEKSVHTVLTSGMFMILATGALGFSPIDPTISQICQSIALGALSATLLVLFVLPGMLSALDRVVAGRRVN